MKDNDEGAAKNKIDSELLSWNRLNTQLLKLDPEARVRALTWLCERHIPKSPHAGLCGESGGVGA